MGVGASKLSGRIALAPQSMRLYGIPGAYALTSSGDVASFASFSGRKRGCSFPSNSLLAKPDKGNRARIVSRHLCRFRGGRAIRTRGYASTRGNGRGTGAPGHVGGAVRTNGRICTTFASCASGRGLNHEYSCVLIATSCRCGSDDTRMGKAVDCQLFLNGGVSCSFSIGEGAVCGIALRLHKTKNIGRSNYVSRGNIVGVSKGAGSTR